MLILCFMKHLHVGLAHLPDGLQMKIASLIVIHIDSREKPKQPSSGEAKHDANLADLAVCRFVRLPASKPIDPGISYVKVYLQTLFKFQNASAHKLRLGRYFEPSQGGLGRVRLLKCQEGLVHGRIGHQPSGGLQDPLQVDER